MRGFTFYSRSAGMEIRAVTRKTDSGKEGRIALRFFTFGDNGSESMRFVLNPLEAYDLYLKTLEIVKKGGKQYLTHRFKNRDGEEIETRLRVERWEKNGKSGYAYALKRGDSDAINVSMDHVSFMYTGELLRTLATEQAWFTVIRETEQEEEEVVEEDF